MVVAKHFKDVDFHIMDFDVASKKFLGSTLGNNFSFFFDFSRFWLDFGRPRALQKLKKIRKNRCFFAFRFEGGFWKGSGRVLGGFREGFGRILGAFWEGFGWIWGRFCS